MANILILEDRPFTPDINRFRGYLKESEILKSAFEQECDAKVLDSRIRKTPSEFDEIVQEELEANRDIFCLVVDVMLDGVEDLYQFGISNTPPTRSYDAGISFLRKVMRGNIDKYSYYHNIPVLIWTARKWETWLQQQHDALNNLNGYGPLGYALKGENDEKNQIIKFFLEVKKYRNLEKNR